MITGLLETFSVRVVSTVFLGGFSVIVGKGGAKKL
jgi:hypothetical protein